MGSGADAGASGFAGSSNGMPLPDFSNVQRWNGNPNDWQQNIQTANNDLNTWGNNVNTWAQQQQPQLTLGGFNGGFGGGGITPITNANFTGQGNTNLQQLPQQMSQEFGIPSFPTLDSSQILGANTGMAGSTPNQSTPSPLGNNQGGVTPQQFTPTVSGSGTFTPPTQQQNTSGNTGFFNSPQQTTQLQQQQQGQINPSQMSLINMLMGLG